MKRKNKHIYLIIIFSLILLNIFQLFLASTNNRRSRSQTSIAIISPTSTPIINKNDGNDWRDYYQTHYYQSPDLKWTVMIQFVRNFNSECFSDVTILDETGHEVSYLQQDGWRGGYHVPCMFDTNDEDNIMGYTSSFTGWEADNSFILPSRTSPDKKYRVEYKDNYWSLKEL